MSSDTRPAHAAWIVAAVLVVDQAVKVCIKLSFLIKENVTWIPGVFELQFIENDGMAFGWTLPGPTGKYLLTAFRIVAVVFLSIQLARMGRTGSPRGFRRALALILAGAAGNILDSVFYGKLFTRSYTHQPGTWFWQGQGELKGYEDWFRGNVVDMLHITVKWPSWWPVDSWANHEVFPAIFNIADVAITCGVAWIILKQKTWLSAAPPPSPRVNESAQ